MQSSLAMQGIITTQFTIPGLTFLLPLPSHTKKRMVVPTAVERDTAERMGVAGVLANGKGLIAQVANFLFLYFSTYMFFRL